MSIQQQVQAVRARMAAAAESSGRRPEDIALCAATKVQSDDTIRAAIAILGDRSSILGYMSVELCDKLVRVNAVDHACLSDCLVSCGGAAEAVHTHLDEIGRKGAVGVKELAYLHIFCDLFHGKCFLSFLRCADLDPQYHYTTAF